MKPRILFATRLSLPLATAIAALISLPKASGVTKTWTGGTSAWGTAGNWSASGVPAAADDAVFNSTATTKAIYLGTAARSIRSITFDSTTVSSPYTIHLRESSSVSTVRVLNLGAGGAVVDAGNHTLKGAGVDNAAAEVVLTTGSTFSIAEGATLNLEAKLGGTSTNTLSKTGLGTLVIKQNNGGTNSWLFSNGLFTVSAGTVDLALNGASGNSGNKYSVTSGATLKISAAGGWGANNGALTLNGSGLAGVGALYSTVTTGVSPVTFLLATTSSIGVDASQNLTLGSAISGTGTAGLAKLGAGNILLNGANTYTGATTVSAGKIVLGNPLALQFSAYDTTGSNGTSIGLDVTSGLSSNALTLGGLAGSVDLASAITAGYTGSVANLILNPQGTQSVSYSGIISDGAVGMSLTKAGTGTQALAGAGSYTGPTTIEAGTLVLNNETALGGATPGTNGTSAISMAAGTTLRSNFIGAGAGYVNSFVHAPITLSGSGNVNLQIGAGTASAPSPAVVFNLNGAIGGTTGNLVFSTSSATLNNSDSTFILGAAGTYSGNTLLTTGNTANRINVKAGVVNALPVTTVLTLDGGNGSGSGRAVQYDLNGNHQTLAGLTNNTTRTLRNQRVTNTSTTPATLTIHNATDYTYGGLFTGSTNTSAQIVGNLALTKNGPGKFTLAAGAGNAFTGDTTILGGILSLEHPTSIQSSSLNTDASIAGDASNGLRTTVNTLTLGGLKGSSNFATLFSTSMGGSDGTTANGGYDGLTALTLNPPTGASPVYAGNLTDATVGMTLTKSGAGTQTLSGVINHSGSTTITAGILTLDYSTQDSSKLSDTAPLILAGGTLNLLGGTHPESVLSTSLTAGTVSRVTSSGAAPLQMNSIAVGENSVIDFGAADIATTDNRNNDYGILGPWATVNGSLAVNSTNSDDGLISSVISTDVTRLDGGPQIIPDGSANHIRIIEGTGTIANINLASPITSVNTLFQTSVGGSSPAYIDSGSQTLRSNAIIVASGTGSLTLGNGFVTPANAGGVLDLNNGAAQGTGTELSIQSVIQNHTSSSSVSKGGIGLVSLTNENTYSGTTTINGGALRISHASALGSSSGGVVVNGGSAGAQSNARLELSGGITVTGETATLSGVGNFYGPLTSFSGFNEWAGDVILASSTAQTRLGASAGATLKVSGMIDDDGINALGLAIRCENNTGTVILSGANTYLGDTSLLIGRLQLDGGNNRLPVATKFSMGNAANVVEFDLNGRSQEVAGLAIFSGSTAANNSINNSDSGSLSILTVNTATASPSTFGGVLKGNLALVKSGPDILTLTGANVYTGGTTISGGTLLGNITQTLNSLGGGDVSIGSGATLLLDNQSITNATNLPTINNIFTGSGLLNLQFAANTTARSTFLPNVTGFSGTIELSNLGATGDKWAASNIGPIPGSLVVDSGSTIFVTGASGISFANGVTLAGAGNSEGRGAIRLSGATSFGGNIGLAGSSTINMENAAASVTGNISGSVSGTHTLTLGATGSVGGTLSGNISDGAGTLAVSNATGAYTLSGNLSHTGGVNVAGGLLTLSGPGNTYTGTTTIAAVAGRSLLVTSNNALGAVGEGNETIVGANGQVGLSGGIIYSAAEKIIGSGTGNTSGQSVFANVQRGFIQSVSGNNTFAGDIEINAGGTSRIGAQDGAQLTLTGAITQATGNILFRLGPNLGDFVTLSNSANSFGGDSTIFTAATAGNWAGVRLGVSNALPTNLTISGLSSTGVGTALDLNGKNQTLNGLINGAALNIINLDNLNPSSLTLNPTSDKTTTNTVIVGGAAFGTIHLVKDGTFAQTLSGANTYTGTTTVNAGSLTLGASGSIADSSGVTLAPAGVFNTTAKTSYAIPASQALTFGIDPAGPGSSGRLVADGLDISAAAVTISPTATLDDPVYILATYTSGSLTGTAFASVIGLPSGYSVNYAYENDKIALVQSAANDFAAWASLNGVTGGSNGDHDDDGVSNLIEYALADGAERGSLTGKIMNFTKRGAPWGSDLTYAIETSADLGVSDPWQLVTPDVNDNSNIQFELEKPGDNFGRLKVIQNGN